MLNPGDIYTMTDTRRAVRLPSGRPEASVRSGVTLRPRCMMHRVFGKKVVEEVRIDAGQTLTPEGGVWKTRGSDTIRGTSESLFEWSRKTQECIRLGSQTQVERTPPSESGKSNCHPNRAYT